MTKNTTKNTKQGQKTLVLSLKNRLITRTNKKAEYPDHRPKARQKGYSALRSAIYITRPIIRYGCLIRIIRYITEKENLRCRKRQIPAENDNHQSESQLE